MALSKYLTPGHTEAQLSEHATSDRTRSSIMARIRSKNTGPEIQVRKALHRAGYRFRLHYSRLPGRPDLALPRFRLAIFVNGCFWHWHGCRHSRMPAHNRDYWTAKIFRNQERDLANHAQLSAMGWRLKVIWECEVKTATERLIVDLDSECSDQSRSAGSPRKPPVSANSTEPPSAR
ncbi:MAG: DNA mismatch endonuclease Vsr [Chloroflexi bacterium]|nr:DNA mismatch endonuclease Vsr [Chloroflexota bacterium]